MTEDRFLERLRKDARPLQYQGDDFVATRIAARVHERVSRTQTVPQLLAAWLRPIAASLAAIIVTLTITLTWSMRHQDQPDTMSSNSVEIAMAGETFSVGD